MFILKPLARRPIALLWGGQVLSNVGDEIYKVAVIWLAAGLIGVNAGYFAALQAASAFVFSLFGGIWADHWDQRKTMVWVDIARGFVVFLLPVVAFFHSPPLWLLAFVVMIVSSFSAFFDPALRATFPELASDVEVLQATNGLMETTYRLARIIGPGLIALLNPFVSLIHFFTIDAASFFFSALSISLLKNHIRPTVVGERPPLTVRMVKDSVLSGAKLVEDHSLMKFILPTSGIVNAAWFLVFPLAITLMIHQKMPGNVGAVGMIIASYGVGNVFSNLIIGSIKLSRPSFTHFVGRIIIGTGFLGIAFAPSLHLMMLAASIAAMGGPMTDLSFLMIVQREFKRQDIAKLFRLMMTIDYGAMFLCLMMSPLLFRLLSIPAVIGISGLAILIVGVMGCVKFAHVPSLILETATES